MRILIVVASFFLLAGIVNSREKNRFEQLDFQEMDVKGGPEGNYLDFEVFHDTETGQEIVCITEATSRFWRAPSCYLTGRVWK